VGETVVDTNRRGYGEPNVHFAIDADEPRFVAMLLEIFARKPAAA
jgi:inosine-uridine nucleoside N-ribohydrolase